jgi:hypothetical protein
MFSKSDFTHTWHLLATIEDFLTIHVHLFTRNCNASLRLIWIRRIIFSRLPSLYYNHLWNNRQAKTTAWQNFNRFRFKVFKFRLNLEFHHNDIAFVCTDVANSKHKHRESRYCLSSSPIFGKPLLLLPHKRKRKTFLIFLMDIDPLL